MLNVMFEKLKNYISEFERICDKSNKTDEAGKLTHEEMCYLKLADLHLALALLDDCGCDVRKVAKIILAETEK